MPITDLNVSINPTDEKHLIEKGFQKLNINLNKRGGGNAIYLWYKQDSGSIAITRVQVSLSEDMAAELKNAGYIQICNALSFSKPDVYLWYFRGSGSYHTPILKIDATTEPANEAWNFNHGMERVACDVNREDPSDRIFFWLKRENPTYICDVAATDSYRAASTYLYQGYIRVDEDTNRGARGGGKPVFIWFRQTTDSQGAVNDLKVSTNPDEYVTYEKQGYTSVKVNLNEGTNGDKVTLWFKKGSNNPIQAITLLLNKALIENYRKAGLTVIEEDLNTGNGGCLEYLCYYNK